MSKSFLLSRIISQSEQPLLTAPPIFLISFVFALGICLAYFVPFSFFSIVFVASAVLILLSISTGRFYFLPLSLCVFLLIGILFGINSRTRSDRDIALNAPEGWVVLDGTVVSAPESVMQGRKETVSFIFDAKSFFRNGFPHETEGKVQIFLYNPRRSVQFGDFLRLRGILEIPKGPRNPYSFDYAAYLGRSNISKMFRGIGPFCILRQSQGKVPRILRTSEQLRFFLKGRLKELYPSPYHELAAALIFGFRKNIDRKIQDDFIKTGTAHLLAISGMNISLVAGLFYLVLSFLRLPRSFNLILTAVFIGVYALLAGSSSPVLRAAVMGVIVLLGFLLGQDRNLKSAFFFSFFVLLAFKPNTLFQASFQLSFIAMAALIYILPPLEQAAHFLGLRPRESVSLFLPREKTHLIHFQEWLRRFKDSMIQTFLASLAATVGMFPVLVWYFNLFSAVGFLANMIVIPLCTISIACTLFILLLDLVFAPMAHGLAFVPLIFFRLELWFTNYFARIPFGYFYLPRPSWLFFIFYYMFLIGWLFLSHRKILSIARSFCLACMAGVLCFFLVGSNRMLPRYVFFDLGKTEAAFILFSNGSTCLINTGRGFPGDQAYWTLRPYLMASGIQKLDGVLFTKIDGIHAGGFRTLIQHVPSRHLWAAGGVSQTSAWKKYIVSAQSKRLNLRAASEGDRIQFGGSSDIFIEPLVVSRGTISAVRISDGIDEIIYLTDITNKTFESLSQRNDLHSDLVFLPHHEFQISESEKAFLKRIAPRLLILNQQDHFEELRLQFGFLSHTKTIFIGESGGVVLTRAQNQSDLTYKTFLKPLTGQIQ